MSNEVKHRAVECNNCDWKGTEDQVDPGAIEDFFQRVDVGDEMPAGECPECGCLCFLIEDTKPLIEAAPELLQACKDAAEVLKTARRYFPKSIRNADKFHLLNVEANSIGKAIAKAEGK